MGCFKPLLQVLHRLVWLEINWLLAGKVYSKVLYRGVFLMNEKLKQPPNGLSRADISAVKVLVNFVIII